MARTENFIDYACRKIREYDLKEHNLYVVLPSLRLERSLRERLARIAEEQKQTPCFLPRFTTIDRLITEFSLLRKGEQTELIAHLYAAYREASPGEDIRTPDQFYDWASMLISDFNAIDNQLAPARDILQYVAEEKRIGAWNLDLNEKAGLLQSRYLQFYQKLWPVYQDFTQRLLQAGCAYTGLAGRTAAALLPQLLQEGHIPDTDFYLFCGLNALTQAEKSIIKTLVQAGRAETVWNADAYYMEENSPQEAGRFLRQYRQDPDLNHNLHNEDFSDNLHKLPYRLIPCPQNTGQAKMAALLLSTEPDPAKTLVVLNDESLLAPLMNALPEHIPCNVSIAGGLAGTRSGELFHTLLQAREEVWQNGGNRLKGDYVIRLLQNPFIKDLAPQIEPVKQIDALLNGFQNYFSKEDFRAIFTAEAPYMDLCTEFIFDAESPRFFLIAEELCVFLLKQAEKSMQGSQQSLFGEATGKTAPVYDALEIHYLNLLEEACDKQNKILEAFPDVVFGAQSLKKILEGCLSGIGINYMGNSVSSLNVMGMLETRGMCFEHVMILSVNEGILPKNATDESFLLYSIKQHYGLPTEKEETAMAAHHFYSLLQNSQRATLLYCDSTSEAGCEPSRFILQLKHELPENEMRIGPDGAGEAHTATAYPFPLLHPDFHTGSSFEIPKTPALLKALKNWLGNKWVSFSALSQFLSCPMQFYYQRILGIEEPPQISDELDAATKGSVFHSVMEDFFCGRGPDRKVRLNRALMPQDADDLLKHKDVLVAAAMEKEFPKGTYRYGVNHVAHQEIMFWVERYAALLRKEIENGKLIVKSCEKKFLFSMPDAFEHKSVTLVGYADRIDLYDNGDTAALRIVDYKTGSVKNLELEGASLNDNLELLQSGDGKQAFQLLMYLYLYQKEMEACGGDTAQSGTTADDIKTGISQKVEAHICSVRTDAKHAYASMYPLQGEFLRSTSLKEIATQTENFLRTVFAKMLDPGQPIVPAPGDSCQYCPYAPFCHSEVGQENN